MLKDLIKLLDDEQGATALEYRAAWPQPSLGCSSSSRIWRAAEISNSMNNVAQHLG